MLATLMSYFRLGLFRVLTGSQARWYGGPPKDEVVPVPVPVRRWVTFGAPVHLIEGDDRPVFLDRAHHAAIAVRADDDGETSALRRSDRPKFEGVLRTTGFMALMIWIGWLPG